MAQTGFLERTLQLRDTTYRFQIYVPVEYTPEREWSVILYLHGADEAGEDGETQTQVGLGPIIRQHPERFPAIVVFPQARNRRGWRSDMAELAVLALEKTMGEFRCDPDRVYLTGVSMGGYGTWYLALMHPERYAALLPICGGLDAPSLPERPKAAPDADKQERDFAGAAQRIRHVPAWVFHGEQDKVVPVDESRRMVEALREQGSDVRYTEYADAGHNSWDETYSDPQVISWLLSRSRRESTESHASETEPEVMG